VKMKKEFYIQIKFHIPIQIIKKFTAWSEEQALEYGLDKIFIKERSIKKKESKTS